MLVFFKIVNFNNKFVVDELNSHEIKIEVLDFTGDSEKIGDIITGEYKQSTAKRFENIEAYESSINNIDMDYDADDSSFGGYI